MSSAVALGKNARTAKMIPMTTPTRREAMPVTSVSETLDEYVVFGNVPSRPERRLPRPSELSAPCTTRKSVARRFLRDTCWMATPSPTVSIAPTRVTTMKAGKSAQNSMPGVNSMPGHEPNGTPTQADSRTAFRS